MVSPDSMAQTLGKYTLVRKLATGGMAEVFLARSDGPMGFQKKLVVKRILPHFGEDQNFINMFLSERARKTSAMPPVASLRTRVYLPSV